MYLWLPHSRYNSFLPPQRLLKLYLLFRGSACNCVYLSSIFPYLSKWERLLLVVGRLLTTGARSEATYAYSSIESNNYSTKFNTKNGWWWLLNHCIVLRSSVSEGLLQNIHWTSSIKNKLEGYLIFTLIKRYLASVHPGSWLDRF